jgi:hypothetical protein
MRLALLALVAVLVAAFLTTPALAKGGGGGGGHAGGGGGAAAPGSAARNGSGEHESGDGGGAAKPSGSKEAETPVSSKGGTGYESPPQAVGSRSNPYYGYPGYGFYHNNLSNFFLWYWLFHPHHRCDRNTHNEATQSDNQSSSETASERCDFDYQYRYGGEPNYGAGGWVMLAVLGTAMAVGLFTLKKYRGVVRRK